MTPFNIPTLCGTEEKYIHEAISLHRLCGDGDFTKRCNRWLEEKLNIEKALLTTSCTHAIEMAVMLVDVKEGDEVIMPSFTFVSTADAVVLRGAVPVFVDIRPDTMNIDETLIEDAITDRTKAIMPVHYAGVPCEMDIIMDIADRHHLKVIEDAAQAIGSTYKGRACGTFGDFGCLSFHETKNITMGEGGALLIRDKDDIDRAEIIREKGTDRSKFWRGEIDKYTWVDVGSSYLPSELNAAYLWGQMEAFNDIQKKRMKAWKLYYSELEKLEKMGNLERPKIPEGCVHNAHIFYIKVRDINERTDIIRFLSENDVNSVFHYVPLHSSAAGIRYGRFNRTDVYTTRESERLLRLPMFYGIEESEVLKVTHAINDFYRRGSD